MRMLNVDLNSFRVFPCDPVASMVFFSLLTSHFLPALGDTVAEARQQAYRCIGRIKWPDMYYRTDIGYRAIAREESEK